jgi:hypothetical protein
MLKTLKNVVKSSKILTKILKKTLVSMIAQERQKNTKVLLKRHKKTTKKLKDGLGGRV